MAWIRLDDQIAHHPKVLKVGLSAWLYVACIAFAQRFLTDGFIPDDAIKTLCGGVDKPILHIRKLVTAGLLERLPNGYQVHDYLDFNESAETVKTRREEDRSRKRSGRNPAGIQPESSRNDNVSGRNPAGVLARARASSPYPSSPIPSEPISKVKVQADQEADASTTSAAPKSVASTAAGSNSRSKRPIFSGQRFVVFDWQLEDLRRLLGPEQLDAFDVHDWFFKLDAEMATANVIIPTRDGGQWLVNQVLDEARRRGLRFSNDNKISEQSKQNVAAMHGAIARIQGKV